MTGHPYPCFRKEICLYNYTFSYFTYVLMCYVYNNAEGIVAANRKTKAGNPLKGAGRITFTMSVDDIGQGVV